MPFSIIDRSRQDFSVSIALFLTCTFHFSITDYVIMLVKGNSFFEIHSLHVSIRIDNEKKKKYPL